MSVPALLLFAGPLLVGSPPPLTQVADVPLPGGATRFDYQAVDPIDRRLYIAHLGDGSLVAFDLAGSKVVKEVPGLPSVHGVGVAHDKHLVFATATADRTLAIIDATTLQIQSRVPAGAYPNGLAYDPGSNRVFVSNNSGPNVAVVDVATAHALPSIDIGGGAGNTQLDPTCGHVFAAVHGQGYLAEIDPRASRVVSRLVLTGVYTCHGLLVAQTPHVAFAVCHGSGPVLVVVDLDARRQTATLPLPPDVDVLAFDSGLQRLYAASEPGLAAVFSIAADHAVSELGRQFIGINAHSVAVDPSTHRVYFPLMNVAGSPVLRVMDPTLTPPTPTPLACKNIGELCSNNAECCAGHCYVDKNPRTPPRPNCHEKAPPREE